MPARRISVNLLGKKEKGLRVDASPNLSHTNTRNNANHSSALIVSGAVSERDDKKSRSSDDQEQADKAASFSLQVYKVMAACLSNKCAHITVRLPHQILIKLLHPNPRGNCYTFDEYSRAVSSDDRSESSLTTLP